MFCSFTGFSMKYIEFPDRRVIFISITTNKMLKNLEESKSEGISKKIKIDNSVLSQDLIQI